MTNTVDSFPLVDAITSLRVQIGEAAKRALQLPKEERFRITEAEIELTVVAEDSAAAGVEVGWWILKAKTDLAHKDAVTHVVRLKLDLGAIEVGSQTPTR